MHYIYTLNDYSGNVVYIGQTKNVNARVRQHKDKKFYSYESFEVESKEVALELEKQLIEEFQPIYNKVHGLSNRDRMALAWDYYRETGCKSKIEQIVHMNF